MDKRLTAICGDAIQEMKKIPANSVNLIVTDPPYNLNKDYGNNQDSLAFDEYISFSKEWLTEAKRVLADDGSIYVFNVFHDCLLKRRINLQISYPKQYRGSTLILP